MPQSEYNVSEVPGLTVPVVTGAGSVQNVGVLAVQHGGHRALVVTDAGVARAGHADVVLDHLRAAGLEAEIYSNVHENPTTDDVHACVEPARAMQADILVAVGGGSSLDTAKGCNFIFTNGGRMQDYRGVDKASQPMLPFIAVPTTAGTGSECQRFALISDPDTHQKMACGDVKALASVAILDPVLTCTQPPFVAACTGMDAVSHAVETAVTNVSTEESLALSHEAFRLLIVNLPRVVSDPDDLAARAAVQMGAALAGSAIERSMLGGAHSAANPLTAHYDIPHGQAVGLMLSHVVTFNGEDGETSQRYASLVRGSGQEDPASTLNRCLGELMDILGLHRPLETFGLGRKNIGVLATEAADQWTARFNPRPLTAGDFERFYESAF